ncbi:uncharacterized protein PHACADRAFT_201693 [Phanerochaete carnosa HHB-10118-sp]|uniref:hydroxymethylglutaryl-CoA reductase (NADPH) n=1 Tax=Phanerochaete carnosa (strain HHB-10118-sp) TaxID=650164 RepID=K5VE74_PHACS|nr:uncharacterized protein PHACADRAFT_201693 [Phanerochaete carnosa HHB-10118-sp]EKM49433.1 hypothetical protein PHACADRAFT_201693 [Phanerochaete carnosa HHB-10118-sp]
MATAEGALAASTSHGCKALNSGEGDTTIVTYDGMIREPAIDLPNNVQAAAARVWIENSEGHAIAKEAFESTLPLRYAPERQVCHGRSHVARSKALELLSKEFPEVVVLMLSGSYCTDKKPAAINWIGGHSKSIVAEAIIPGKIVKTVLKTTIEVLCNLNTKKSVVSSATADSVGGFNAHAANILTAISLAAGHDLAQNVESSNCMTVVEPTNSGEDLLIVSMPCIKVGTVGGGTIPAPQEAVLDVLGLKSAHQANPGRNAQQFARVITTAAMADQCARRRPPYTGTFRSQPLATGHAEHVAARGPWPDDTRWLHVVSRPELTSITLPRCPLSHTAGPTSLLGRPSLESAKLNESLALVEFRLSSSVRSSSTIALWTPPSPSSAAANGHVTSGMSSAEEDVCVTKLDEKRCSQNFRGNVLDTGPEIDAGKFISLMYPRIGAPFDFVYSVDRLLEPRGSRDHKGNPCDTLLNVASPCSPRLVVSMVLSLMSAATSSQAAAIRWKQQSIPMTTTPFVALFTSGTGLTYSSDITFGSPMYWLWEIISAQFPCANLCFEYDDN